MSADDLKILIHALCGPNADASDSAENLIGLAFELAIAEADVVTDCLDTDEQGLGYALTGRLKALARFITFHVDTKLLAVEGGAAATEGSAES